MRAFHFLAALVAMAAPATASASRESRAVFRNPAQFVGRTVRVCGYLLGVPNITERRRDPRFGLSVLNSGPGRRLVRIARAYGEYANVCLTGTISYVGCQTDTNIICTDWAFDYAIEVREVE